jgi:hypothetical protein
MPGTLRPSLLRQVISEMDIMDREAHPALGKAKRDCIRALAKNELERQNGQPRLTKRIQGHVYYTRGRYDETIPAEMDTNDVRRCLERLCDYEEA